MKTPTAPVFSSIPSLDELYKLTGHKPTRLTINGDAYRRLRIQSEDPIEFLVKLVQANVAGFQIVDGGKTVPLGELHLQIQVDSTSVEPKWKTVAIVRPLG